jgi:hypothetical protein
LITRQGRVTRLPTMAVWSCGSIANRCSDGIASSAAVDQHTTLMLIQRRLKHKMSNITELLRNRKKKRNEKLNKKQRRRKFIQYRGGSYSTHIVPSFLLKYSQYNIVYVVYAYRGFANVLEIMAYSGSIFYFVRVSCLELETGK